MEPKSREAYEMDIAKTWRSMRPHTDDAPHPGAHLEATAEITMLVVQKCRIALPSANQIPAISVTITSNRPGAAAQVTVAANLNSSDGRYQGPTTIVGQGQFTATNSSVQADFVVLPSGWPVVGIGAEA